MNTPVMPQNACYKIMFAFTNEQILLLIICKY